MAHRTRNTQAGVGYIEVLISSLILALSLLAALSLYGFSMNMITRTGDEGVAYNIARRDIENIRKNGFDPVASGTHTFPDGSTTLYYDSLGGNESSTSSANSKFRLVTTVVSRKPDDSGPDNVQGTNNPAPDAIRYVTATVYYVSTGEQIEQTGTILVRSGV
jgi:hypothetical protein